MRKSIPLPERMFKTFAPDTGTILPAGHSVQRGARACHPI
jgi:hypothetical protein